MTTLISDQHRRPDILVKSMLYRQLGTTSLEIPYWTCFKASGEHRSSVSQKELRKHHTRFDVDRHEY